MEITLDELRIIADDKKLDIVMIEKDYLLTSLLYALKDIRGIYFKGGTALNKIFLNHERLSEDLDFTATDSIVKIENKIKEKLEGTIFTKITHDKRVEGFVRLVVHYKLFHEKGTIFIDLNKRAKIYLKSEEAEIKHFYPEHIPKFKIKTLNLKEIIAEKIAAVVLRYAPRDYYDVYNIIKYKLPIDMKLIKKKFRDNMTNLELVLNMLAEATTKEFSKKENPKTFPQSKKIAKKGGAVAGNARKDIEEQLGESIITKKNAKETHFKDKKRLTN